MSEVAVAVGSERLPDHLQALVFHITKPFVADFEMELNALSIMTGKNGSGKTFFMIHGYVFGEIAKLIVAGLKDQELLASAQFVMTNSFTDLDTEGEVGANFVSGAFIRLKMEQGEIVSLNYEGFEGIKSTGGITYMSSGMRTFDAIKYYLGNRKLILQLVKNNSNAMFIKLLESYRIYDVAYIEGLIAKMPVQMTPILKKRLEDFDVSDDIESFGCDLDRGDFFLLEKGNSKKKYLTSFGNGTQAIFNMTLASAI